MSGPWDDFQPTTAAPTPSGVQLQPWEEYSVTPPAAPSAPAKDPKELQANVTTMLQNKAPIEDVQKYVQSSGYSIDPKTQDWLDKNYAKYSDASVPKQHYSVDVHGQPPQVNALSSWWHGVQSGALRGYDDELEAASEAFGGELGLNNNDHGSYGDRYDRALSQYRQLKDAAFQQHPIAYGLGFVPGSLTGPTLFRAPAATLGGRVAQAAGTGAVEGAAAGSGNAEGGVVDRLKGGAEGAALALPFSMAAYPLGALATHAVARAAEHFKPNTLNSGLDVLASRAPQNADDMAARAAEMRAAGTPPRVVDVVDEGGRGIVRSAAAKNTPARQDLADHANKVYIDMQDRVADQARNNISNAPKTARQYGEQIKTEQDAMGPQFDAVRNNPVAVTHEMTDAFTTAEGRSALRSVSRWMTPAEQQSLNKFASGIKEVGKLDPRLPEPIRRQLTDQIMAGAPLTVDVADKFSRLLTKQAADKPAMMRVAQNYGNIVRGAARQQYPEYDKALTDYAAAANVGNAASGTGKFENTDFMGSHPDQYRPSEASATPAAVVEDGQPGMSEQDMLRVRARDDIVDKAREGSGASAPGVARQVAQGSAQHARNVALLGEDGAARLESGMRNEGRRLENTRYIDPRIGSKTAPMAEDAATMNEGVHFAADAATHGYWGVVRGVSRWLRGTGIRGVDAERLVRDSISEDQSRVNAAIDYLGQKGVERARASGLVRQLRRSGAKLPGRAAGAMVSDEQSSPPPNSVRAILKEGRSVQ